MEVSVVFITWNRAEDLRKTLTHTLRYQQYFNELIVIDNGSEDDTVEILKQEFPQVRLIRLHKNTGVCEARNIGAINANNELVLFLDDDGFFDLHAIPLMVNQFRVNEKLAVLGARIIHVDSLDLQHLDFERFKLPEIKTTKSYEFWGTAFMIRKSIFIRVGMFPDYFFYSNEENDLSLRLIREGYEIHRCDWAVMLHYASPKQRPRGRHTYYYYRNVHFQIWRNLPFWYAVRESLLVTCGGLLRNLIRGNFWAFCKGTLAAMFYLPRIIIQERAPLSMAQYQIYARLRGSEYKLSNRAKKVCRIFFCKLFSLFKNEEVDPLLVQDDGRAGGFPQPESLPGFCHPERPAG